MSIDAETIVEMAQSIMPAMLEDRRWLHSHAETGASLPETAGYVRRRLTEMGYEPQEPCPCGITAAIGSGEPCILLRADMDALAIAEKAPVDFRAVNGNMHACGHDMHTAMLLGAAELLRCLRSELRGTVKLVFQPDEEGFTGAKSMLQAGVLNSPRPQAAMALHVNSGTPSGLLLCGRGTTMAGCTLFCIRVRGTGCHGAMPETGVDPLNIAAHIYLALEEIVSREIAAKTPAVVTVGRLSGGNVPNVIPQEAVLEGTIRSFDRELSARIFSRIQEISKAVASAFRGCAEVTETASAPPLLNNPGLMDELAGYAAGLYGRETVFMLDEGGMGSEDFASFSDELPCAYMLLGAGDSSEDPAFGRPMHNENVVFNEAVLPKGAALHTYCAIKWLEKRGENSRR